MPHRTYNPHLQRSGQEANCQHSALQSAAQELERQRATDSLKKGLEKRPEKEELVERMMVSNALRREQSSWVVF